MHSFERACLSASLEIGRSTQAKKLSSLLFVVEKNQPPYLCLPFNDFQRQQLAGQIHEVAAASTDPHIFLQATIFKMLNQDNGSVHCKPVQAERGCSKDAFIQSLAVRHVMKDIS